MPAVLSGPRILESITDLKRAPGSNRLVPYFQRRRCIIRMKDGHPTLVSAFSLSEPGEFVPPAIEIVSITIRSGCPDDLRHGIRQFPKALIASLQCLGVATQILHHHCIIDRDGRLGGNTEGHLFSVLIKHTGLRVTEE